MQYEPFSPVSIAPVIVNGHVLPKKVALVNSHGEPMSVVSKQYKVVNNQQVVDLFGKAFTNIQIDKITDHVDYLGARWKRRIVLKKDAFNFEVLPNDCVGIMLELFNSYTGKSAWGFRLMGYRWACTNGMIYGQKNLFSATFSHMANIIDKMRDAFQFQIENVGGVIDTWKSWQEIPFSPSDMENYLEYQEVKEKTAEIVMNAFRIRTAYENLPWNQWAAYNTFTYLATHELKTRRRGGDPLFSAGAKKFNKLAEGLYDYNPKQLAT